MCFLGPFLPNHQVHVGQLSSPHCLVHFIYVFPGCTFAKSPSPDWQIVKSTLPSGCTNSKLASPLRPVDCPNELQTACTFFKFLGCQRPEYFFVC